MAERLKTLFFILVLSVSVFSGTPVQGGDMKMKERVCPMKCCKKKAKSHKPKEANNAKFLCRVLVCSQNMPTNTSSTAQMNLAAPAIIASKRDSLFEFLFSTTPKDYRRLTFADSIQPKQNLPEYIRHQRILI